MKTNAQKASDEPAYPAQTKFETFKWESSSMAGRIVIPPKGEPVIVTEFSGGTDVISGIETKVLNDLVNDGDLFASRFGESFIETAVRILDAPSPESMNAASKRSFRLDVIALWLVNQVDGSITERIGSLTKKIDVSVPTTTIVKPGELNITALGRCPQLLDIQMRMISVARLLGIL